VRNPEAFSAPRPPRPGPRPRAGGNGQQSGVDPTVITRFLADQRDLRLGTADRIATALGLRLVEVAPRSRKR